MNTDADAPTPRTNHARFICVNPYDGRPLEAVTASFARDLELETVRLKARVTSLELAHRLRDEADEMRDLEEKQAGEIDE